jgi:fibronectin type 3 domain-containing protein
MQLTQVLAGGGAATQITLLRYTSLVKALFVFIRRCQQRRFRTFILRCSVRILTLGAGAVIVSCAGVSTSTKTVTVTGTGTGASTHTVDLSWVASTSPDVMGYNVYRAVYSNACGPLSKINAALVATTSYTDSTVANGASYCYATTAVDTSNRESVYSNIVSDVQIPAS